MISVIVPIYNAEKYLPELLTSLEKQAEKDLEIILIDDGSTDGSASICKQAADKDKRVHYIYQNNSGVSAARNHALNVATGEHVAFLDADDAVDDNYFSELLAACSDADISVCDILIEMRDGIELKRFTAGNSSFTSVQALDLLLQRIKINSGPCGKLFKRQTIGEVKFHPLKAYEDILFVKDAFAKASSIRSTSNTAYHYYQNAGSAMDKQKKMPSLDIVTATDELIEFTSAHKELNPRCLYITISHLYQYVLALDRDNPESKVFRKAVQKLYRKNWLRLLSCSAFPWKEKIVYSLFISGIRFN